MQIKSHDDLLDILAKNKRSIFTNCYLGNKRANDFTPGAPLLPRADLVVFNPSYIRFLISIYEVKWSRADFLRDLNSEKWRSYLPYCHHFYFAVPKFIPGDTGKRCFLNIKEVPPEAGLIRYNQDKNTWYVRKAAPKRKIEIDLEFLQAMILYKQKGGDKEYWRRMSAKLGELRHVYKYEMKQFGHQVAKAVEYYKIHGDKK
jgi:hypothetical protein